MLPAARPAPHDVTTISLQLCFSHCVYFPPILGPCRFPPIPASAILLSFLCAFTGRDGAAGADAEHTLPAPSLARPPVRARTRHSASIIHSSSTGVRVHRYHRVPSETELLATFSPGFNGGSARCEKRAAGRRSSCFIILLFVLFSRCRPVGDSGWWNTFLQHTIMPLLVGAWSGEAEEKKEEEGGLMIGNEEEERRGVVPGKAFASNPDTLEILCVPACVAVLFT